MTDIVLVDPAETVNVQFNFTGLIGSATLSSVVHTVPSPLVKDAEATNSPITGWSTVKLHGALHGGLYQVEATATLNNGEVVNRAATVRGFNA